MKKSDMNHLRRLLGWIRCDIGQSPAELQQTMIDVADGLGHPEISEEARARMVGIYRRAEAVPLYVRAAVKALEKTLAAGGCAPVADERAAFEEWAGIEYRNAREYTNRDHLMGLNAWTAARAALSAQPGVVGAQTCPDHADGPAAHGQLKKLAAALGNRDWKWWDSCSFRRLTFEDGPNRRDGSALRGTVQASDGHPDVSMAPGVREFIEATSPQAIASLCVDLAAKNRALEIVRSELAALVSECERADAQADRELRRTFIYPNVLEGARRALANHKAGGDQTC